MNKNTPALNKPVHFFVPFSKKDDEQRMVYGYASTETLDSQGEIVKIDAIKAALPDYMKFGNIREMHQPSAVGKTKEAMIDAKGLWIGAKVVDDIAWKKVKEEVYSGFSIGGSIVEKLENEITGINLKEISLVDRPANPDAVFEIVKIEDGKPAEEGVEEKTEDGGDDPVANDSADEDQEKATEETPAADANATPDEDKDADKAAADAKEVADQSTDMKKSIWTADRIIQIATCLADLISFYSIDGKNIDDLVAALASLKDAAIVELSATDEFIVPTVEFTTDMYETIEAADKIVELHKADVEKAAEVRLAKKASQDNLKMPTDDEIVAALEKQGMPINDATIGIVRAARADEILGKIKAQQATGAQVDEAKLNIERELTKTVKALQDKFAQTPELDPFVHYEMTKNDDTDPTDSVPPATDDNPENGSDDIPVEKANQTEEPATLAKADLSKLDDRLAKVEQAIEKMAALEERIVNIENSEKPTTVRGAMTVERFGKEDTKTDEMEMLEKIESVSLKLRANPHDEGLRREAETLYKQYTELKKTN